MELSETIKKAIKEYQEAKQMEKEAKALMSSAKDNLSREVVNTLETEGYATDSTLYVDGVGYSVKATERAVIDPSMFLALYDEGKISREVLIACMTIGKEKAEELLGKASLEDLVTIKQGDKEDLRVSKADKKSNLAVGVAVVGNKSKTETQFTRKILLKVTK